MIHGLESLFLWKTIDAFYKSQYFRSLQTFVKTCQLFFPVENTAIFQNKRLQIYLSVVNTQEYSRYVMYGQEYRFGIQVVLFFPVIIKMASMRTRIVTVNL